MPVAQAPAVPSRTATPESEAALYIKEEPIDPLKLDLGAEELAFKAEVVPEAKVGGSSWSPLPRGGDADLNPLWRRATTRAKQATRLHQQCSTYNSPTTAPT